MPGQSVGGPTSWLPPDPLPFMGAWQPLQRRTLPPSITAVAVNNPPFSHNGRLRTTLAVIRTWDPPPPSPFIGERQPTQARNLPPSITAVAVNNPPFSQRRPLPGILISWMPPDPPPQRPENLAVGIPGQSVDRPPRQWAFLSLLAPEVAQPAQPRAYAAPFQVVVSGPTAATPWLNGVLAAWQPADPLPQQLHRSATNLLPTAASAAPIFQPISRYIGWYDTAV